MSELENTSFSQLGRPATDDHSVWRAYWQQLGQDWRTEPEISEERQKYLIERRAIGPDVEQGIYPYKDIHLSRADVEWLLATHESGRGPVDWSDVSQREREGLDLRGADLRGEDLRRLPLARLRAGLDWMERHDMTPERLNKAAACFAGADMRRVHMEGATLCRANLEKATLYYVHLERANCVEADFRDATLYNAYFDGADVSEAHFEGAYLFRAQLYDADMRGAFVNAATNLEGIALGKGKEGCALLADVHWSDTNLAVIDWRSLKTLGDERQASRSIDPAIRLDKYRSAVRANRQLAVALRAQGLDEDAARFSYRGQKLQRITMRLQHHYIQYVFSVLLDLLAGYGYRPVRTLLWYLLVVGGFAAAYALSGHLPALPDALVYSLTSFHGRGFFPGLGSQITLHNPLVVVAAAEAVIGLFIEISFIATFTQRYFGK